MNRRARTPPPLIGPLLDLRRDRPLRRVDGYEDGLLERGLEAGEGVDELLLVLAHSQSVGRYPRSVYGVQPHWTDVAF